MLRSNTSKKEDLLNRLKLDLEEAEKDLENGVTRDKIENIFFLENAIESLEYDICNRDFY